MKRLIVVVVVVVLVIAGYAGWRAYVQAQTPQEPTYETAVVTRSSLQSTVSASGTIEPEAQVSLNFRGVGRVAAVEVGQGQAVQTGQMLASLDVQDLNLAVTQAEAALASTQANLAQLTAAALPEDMAAAEAAVQSATANVKSAEAGLTSARAALAKLLAGSTENEKTVAAANLERARVALQQAQTAFDQVASLPNVGLLPQSSNLQRATIDYEQARAQYEITTASADNAQRAQAAATLAQSEAAVASAKAQLAQAQASLAKLKLGASPDQIAVARAQVRQAESSLEQAKLAVENATLKAPLAGVVAQLSITVGELPSAAQPAIILVDTSRYHIDTYVDEIDIGQIQVGQRVSITLEALPNASVTGQISYLAPTATVNAGVVSYLVTVVLDPTSASLRAGMTATANITTAEIDNALILPNRAIQLDRDSGKTFVEKLVNGAAQRIEVQLGMRNEGSSQVVAGVNEGDTIIIRNATAGEQLRQSFGF